jgi:hypothetical protein
MKGMNAIIAGYRMKGIIAGYRMKGWTFQ